MTTNLLVVLALVAIGLVAYAVSCLRAISNRLSGLAVWFDALDLERRREHLTAQRRDADQREAWRLYRHTVTSYASGIRETLDAMARAAFDHLEAQKAADDRRTIEAPPPRELVVEGPTSAVPETEPRAGASPVSRERPSPTRALDPSGSASTLPAGPGMLAAGLARPAGIRPPPHAPPVRIAGKAAGARAGTLVGGLGAPPVRGEVADERSADGDRLSDGDAPTVVQDRQAITAAPTLASMRAVHSGEEGGDPKR